MKVSSLRALSSAQWWAFVQAWVLLWPAQWRLRINRTHTWLPNNDGEAKKGDASLLTIAQNLHESVRLAARCHPTRAACLPKSMVLVQLLRARRISAQLRLGVSRGHNNGTPSLASHAWVEVEGQAVCEPDNVTDDFHLVNTVPPGL